MQTLLGKHWHHLPNEEVITLLESDTECGLDIFEVRHRQERFGSNTLTTRKGKPAILRFLLQFNNPLLYILIASSIVTVIFKDIVDAAVIFGVVLINAIIGYIQEARAEKSIEALANTISTETTVLRSGTAQRMDARQLVIGDIVLLRAGDKVPADLRLLKTRDLQVAEAALTGESLPVQKDATSQEAADTVLAERRNMAYASTLVTYGTATGIVIAIGDTTEVGRISSLIHAAPELQTPLTKKIARFSGLLIYVILGFTALSLVTGFLRGMALIDTLMAAIALAVSAIPEGLPAALTITLAIGVSRMAQRRAIIRKLPVVETLGSTTVICSDKTGTLTENQMTVKDIHLPDAFFEVSGSGYAPQGKVLRAGQAIDLQSLPGLRETLAVGMLCNDSNLVNKAEVWTAEGDPTEVALLTVAQKAGLDRTSLQAGLPRLDEIPFNSTHQFMATLHDAGTGRRPVVYLKGSVESLLEKCASAQSSTGGLIKLDPQAVHDQVESMAQHGLRVLAFARGELPAAVSRLSHESVSAGLTFLGLVGMIDPPRPEAVAAVAACQQAGIQVKMITGDHALTAAAIGRQVGLQGLTDDPSQGVLTGKALSSLNDEQLVEAAAHTSVFARVSPEQKLRLVEALQYRGEVVAMTGDGVNDGPALKQADIGIAMGITGTDVAKEAADMLLTDDNFATIRAAVEEGRRIFDNLVKIIAWTLPTNLGQGLIVLLAILLGITLPVTPLQILWINMTTASVLGLTLAFEAAEGDIMQRRPRKKDAPILNGALLVRVVIVALIIAAGAFGLFEYELAQGYPLAEARTMAVNVVIMVEMFYLFNCRSLNGPAINNTLLRNRWVWLGVAGMILLQAGFTYLPFMNVAFGSAPIPWVAWLEIVAISAAGFLLLEVIKWLQRRGQA